MLGVKKCRASLFRGTRRSLPTTQEREKHSTGPVERGPATSLNLFSRVPKPSRLHRREIKQRPPPSYGRRTPLSRLLMSRALPGRGTGEKGATSKNRQVSLVYLVIWFVWLNQSNQMNKTNQMNQINQSRPSRLSACYTSKYRTYSYGCGRNRMGSTSLRRL